MWKWIRSADQDDEAKFDLKRGVAQTIRCDAIATPVITSTAIAISDPIPKRRAAALIGSRSSAPRNTGTDHSRQHQLSADEERHREQVNPEEEVPKRHRSTAALPQNRSRAILSV